MTESNTFPGWKSVIIGLLAGLLAGLFGIGGGFIMVPLFVLWLGLAQKRAHATSLLAVAFIAAAAVNRYANLGQIDWASALLVTCGAVCGIFLGIRLLTKISEKSLTYIFAFVLLCTAIRLIWSATPHQIFSGLNAQLFLVIIGFFAGALAGLLGVGGGIVIVPALIICSGLEPGVARGTSLVVILVSSLVGVGLHHRAGTIDHKVAFYSGIAGIPAAVLGTYIGAHTDNDTLIAMFSVLLVVLAGQLLVTKRGQ